MSSYSVSLPLTQDSKDVFKQIKDFKSLTRQNLKMLLLTNPGERIMVPDFGVGLKRYLFEQTNGTIIYNPRANTVTGNDGVDLTSNIEDAIAFQINKYMNYITLINLSTSVQEQALMITLEYSIPSINSTDKFVYIDTNSSIVVDSDLTDNSRIVRGDKAGFRNFSVDLTKETYE